MQPARAPGARFQDCFGAWNRMCAFLSAIDFLRLQLINRKAYNTTVSRTQVRWSRQKLFHFMVDSDGPNSRTIFEYSLATRTLQPKKANNFCFAASPCSAVVEGRVYTIAKPGGEETHDLKMLSIPHEGKQPRDRTLPMPTELSPADELLHLVNCGNRKLLLIYDTTQGREATEAWQYDLLENRWLDRGPTLTDRRREGSAACLLGSTVYVFGGSNDCQTIEYLDLNSQEAGWGMIATYAMEGCRYIVCPISRTEILVVRGNWAAARGDKFCEALIFDTSDLSTKEGLQL